MSCEKDVKMKDINENSVSFKKTISKDYIDSLSYETNIDIYELASSPELLSYMDTVSLISKEISENLLPIDSYSEEDFERMNELIQLISAAVDDNNFELVDQYYNELLILLFGNNHQWCDVNNFSQSEIVEQLNSAAYSLTQFLTKDYNAIYALNDDQTSRIAESITYIMDKEAGNPNKCAKDRANAIRDAEIVYGISVGVCCFTGPAAFPCVAGALAVYCVAHNRANQNYKTCMQQ